MAQERVQEANEQITEGQRFEQARRLGMGIPDRRGVGVPPQPKRQEPAPLGGAPRPVVLPPSGSQPGTQPKRMLREDFDAMAVAVNNRPKIPEGPMTVMDSSGPSGYGTPGSRPKLVTPQGAMSVMKSSPPEPSTRLGSLGNPRVKERDDRAIGQPVVRRLPAKKLIDATDIPGHGAPSMPVDKDSIVKAIGQGFANGFMEGLAGRMGQNASETDAAEIAALPPAADLNARMERFSELRGVTVPTGNAARFPELVQDVQATGEQQPEQDGSLVR